MIIYKATNKINNKVYIGQTVRSLEVRMSEHKRHNYTAFDKAINKYGLENFDVEVIDTAKDINELNEKEIYWIKYYNLKGTHISRVCRGKRKTTGGYKWTYYDNKTHDNTVLSQTGTH